MDRGCSGRRARRLIAPKICTHTAPLGMRCEKKRATDVRETDSHTSNPRAPPVEGRARRNEALQCRGVFAIAGGEKDIDVLCIAAAFDGNE